MTVAERAAKYVAKMEVSVSGAGGHTAAFEVAVTLVKGFLLEECAAMRIFEEWNRGCQPPWSAADLQYKLRSARRANRPDGYLLKERPERVAERVAEREREGRAERGEERAAKPCYDPERLRARVAEAPRGVDEVWLANRSLIDPTGVGAAVFLRTLYFGERVLTFSDPFSQGVLWPEEGIAEDAGQGVWFLVNPVSGVEWPNPRTGKMSRRSEESVTRWSFFLLESDVVPAAEWLPAVVASRLPVVAIYTSGGRSIHVLLRCEEREYEVGARVVGGGRKEDLVRVVGRIAGEVVGLGADPAALTPVRLSRLPGKKRGEKGRWQRLLYLDPSGARGLADMPARRDIVGELRAASSVAYLAGDVARLRRCLWRLGGLVEASEVARLLAVELREIVEGGTDGN